MDSGQRPGVDVEVPAFCSFCGRPQEEVGRLVRAGATDVAICEACVRLCLDVFED